MVVVPLGKPRTKAVAFKHALAAAIGDYVVVHAPEDLANPGQLREALAAIIGDSENSGCVLARLIIYNALRSEIGHDALFGAILPTLEQFGLLIPLEGTSNHIPRRSLERADGWDTYNVNEGADLRSRLAGSATACALFHRRRGRNHRDRCAYGQVSGRFA